MLISETKIDKIFDDSHFKINAFSNLHRINHNEKGGGILSVESYYIEVILEKTKWLINYSYNPTKNNVASHLESLSGSLKSYTSKFENILVIGVLNISVEENNMKYFCESYNLKSLMKVPTFYKNPESPSCIDLIFTNKPRNFQNSSVIETSPSDFHKITVTSLKMRFCK